MSVFVAAVLRIRSALWPCSRGRSFARLNLARSERIRLGPRGAVRPTRTVRAYVGEVYLGSSVIVVDQASERSRFGAKALVRSPFALCTFALCTLARCTMHFRPLHYALSPFALRTNAHSLSTIARSLFTFARRTFVHLRPPRHFAHTARSQTVPTPAPAAPPGDWTHYSAS